MNKELNNNWNDLKCKLKKKFPLLTNADLQWRYTSKEEQLSTLALRLGKTNRELKEIIEKF
jgi:hypothetical protein